MALPEPKPGLVIRYDYLWNREAASGRDQGKDRPACLVAAGDSNTKLRFVVILPITHSAPTGDTIGIAIPPRVRQALGLDDDPCWVIVSEHRRMAERRPPAAARTPGSVQLRFHPARLVRADQDQVP